MTSNKKPLVPYAARLARESVKLGLRVGLILGGTVLTSLWSIASKDRDDGHDQDTGLIPAEDSSRSYSFEDATAKGQALYYDRFYGNDEEKGIWK